MTYANERWAEALAQVPRARDVEPLYDDDITSYVMGAQRGSQTKTQLFAALAASTSGRIAPELMMIWRQDRDRTPDQNRRRLSDPTGKKTWYKMGTFFWGLLFAAGGPALLLPNRSSPTRDFILSELSGGVLMAGLLCVVGFVIYVSIERETPRRVQYPVAVYVFYALWSLIGAGIVFGRVLVGGEPLMTPADLGVALVCAVAVAYVVLFLVRSGVLRRKKDRQRTHVMSPSEVQAAVDRRLSQPADSEVSGVSGPVTMDSSSEDVRAAADRELIEHIAWVRTSRDDYDEEKFQREIVGGIEGLCKRGLISTNEAGWMLEQALT